ncbi:MAG: ABC transporter substrate-binding protein, partial [Gammaproteobacteria bacterium]|nr:ABC transporter substrate-binding protein [Gammaproteobacteria bacterium]
AADAGVRAGWGESLGQGVLPASDADYAEIRRLRAGAVIPQQGNF